MDADVIVVGAGAAGLSAARRLAQRSVQTLVLEARDRIGGRIFSVPGGRRIAPAELGAEFIHGLAPQTMAILRTLGSAAVETCGDAFVRGSDGRLVAEAGEFLEAASLYDEARSLERDVSVAAYLERFEAREETREAAHAARAFVEGFDAADPALASVVSIAAEWQSGVDSYSARPVGGYPAIVELLREQVAAFGARVLLESPVTHVAWRTGQVIVRTENRSYTARAAIVTVPVGVLANGDVRFDPPLPPEKRAAVDAIAMGDVVKVVLRFRTAFWEELHDRAYRGAGFFRDRGDGAFSTYWTSMPLHAELVCAWVGGPRASALRQRPREEVIELARDGFGALFDARDLARREFETAEYHDWGDDPYARGAYSYVLVGGGDARAALGAPVDTTLFFAGEAVATNGQGGTVNGALESGERAAEAVLRVLRAAP